MYKLIKKGITSLGTLGLIALLFMGENAFSEAEKEDMSCGCVCTDSSGNEHKTNCLKATNKDECDSCCWSEFISPQGICTNTK